MILKNDDSVVYEKVDIAVFIVLLIFSGLPGIFLIQNEGLVGIMNFWGIFTLVFASIPFLFILFFGTRAIINTFLKR